MAVTTKLNFGSYDTYLEEQKKKAAGTDSGAALSYYRDAAAGKPTAAVSSAIAANREALARQAGNMRMATAQAVAGVGALGQGQAVRGTQETEGKILQALADSRNKEQQAIAADQSSANSVLLSQANSDTSNTIEKLKMGLSSESPAVKAASQRALAQYLNDNGVQQATGDSADAYDKAVADEAENSDEAKLARLTAKTNLANENAKAALNTSGGTGARVIAAFAYNPNIAHQYFNDTYGADAKANNYWNRKVLPALNRGDTASAKALIDSYNSNAGFTVAKAAKTASNPISTVTSAVSSVLPW